MMVYRLNVGKIRRPRMPNAFLNDSVDATLASLYSYISLGQAL